MAQQRFSPEIGSMYSWVEASNWQSEPNMLTFRFKGGFSSDYGWSGVTVNSMPCWYDTQWHDDEDDPYTYTGFTGGTVTQFDYTGSFARQSSDRTVWVGCRSWGTINGIYSSATAEVGSFTIPHYVSPPTIGTVQATGANSISVSWSNPNEDYAHMAVEVSIDGSNFSQFAVLASGATSTTYSAATAGHSYRFRVRAEYLGAYSAYSSVSSAVTTVPSAPTSITTQGVSGTTVNVILTNPSKDVAEKVQYQLSADYAAGVWTSVADASDKERFQVDMGANHYIRVRNYSTAGVSDWLLSSYVQTVIKPNKPKVSASAQKWDEAEEMTFSWVGDYPDGSTQTAYKYRYRIDGGSATASNVITSTDTSLSWDASDFGLSAGNYFELSVAVKGAASSLSDWSAWCRVDVVRKPTVAIEYPSGNPRPVIDGMPIYVQASYEDFGGNVCAEAVCTIKRNGVSVYSEQMAVGEYLTTYIYASELLPDNSARYSLEVRARSSSGMTQTRSIEFDTDFVEPAAGTVDIANDPDTGYATITAHFGEGEVEAVSISVYRVNADGTLTTIIDHGADGAGAVDRYAPLNTSYQYAVTTESEEHAVCTVYFDSIIETNRWFAYWGEEVASATWNPDNGGIQLTRPQKTRVYYAGRKDPVSYDGAAVSLTETPSWMLIEQSEIEPFLRLIEDGGRGVYKSCDGWVYHADFDLTLTPSYTAIGYYGGAQLSITRIAGERL